MLLKVIVECEMAEYEYLILDIIVAWRIYFKIFKNSSYHPQCFICLLNLKILITIKAICSVLSLFKMS